ncbi:NME NM23 member 5 [Cichlidogyrus casuarinus]|uniref:Nucleoside diphosphate kinase homolog 5 n=1 Tax=Cichlidogyrus casuarinus TaxID=1844966 RepID=A0ABD2PYK3_9PLAT
METESAIFVERTLAVVKPDAEHAFDEIEDKILQAGFAVLKKRRVKLSVEQASEFYAEHYGKLFFPTLVTYMSSGPIVAMVLAKKGAIQEWRHMMGPTNSIRAKAEEPESFRALYGTDETQNGFHGSDSFSSAEREIRFFFPDTVMEPIMVRNSARDYLARHVNRVLTKGLTEVCKRKPADPVLWLADWLLKNNPNKPNLN